MATDQLLLVVLLLLAVLLLLLLLRLLFTLWLVKRWQMHLLNVMKLACIGGSVVARIVVWLLVAVMVLLTVIPPIMMHRPQIKVSLVVWVRNVRLLIGGVKRSVVHVVMLDTVDRRVLQVVEELVELMLDRCHHARALVLLNIVHVAIALVRVVLIVVHIGDVMDVEVEIALVRVLRSVRVLVMVPVVSLTIGVPVVRTMLNSMRVVVLINMLWMVLTIVTVRVIVTKVMVSLWLHIVVFAVVLSREVTLVVEVRYMVLELPVALLEMGIRVMLVAVDELSHVRLVVLMSGLIRGHLVIYVILRREVIHGVVLASTLLWRLLRLAPLLGRLALHWRSGLLRRLTTLLLLWLLGLRLTVHLFVVERGFGAQVLLSLGLGLRWLGMVVWVLVMIRVIVVLVADWRVRVRVWLVPLGLHWVVRSVRVSMSCIGIIVLIMSSVWVTNRWVVRSDIWVHSTVGRVAVRIVRVWFTSVMHLSLHMAVVLLGANIVVLVTLLALLALGHSVLRGRLSPNRLDVSRLEGVHTVSHLWVIRLHLEHQITVLNVGLRGAEGSRVGIEGGVV